MLSLLQNPDAWMALLSLTALEIVLGIDNIVFIAVLTDRLPKERQQTAYRIGLGMAMFGRLGLLLGIRWVMTLHETLFTAFGRDVTGHDLILLGGGGFLIAKSASEIYEKVERVEEAKPKGWSNSLAGVVGQIMVLDLVFSLDSVITAIGIVDDVEVMVAAIVISVGIMLGFAKPVGDFVNRHPSMKILGLAFLLMIGVLLAADAFGQHIDKRYVYFAMGFALLIELVNMRFRKRQQPARPDV